jgi:hypothetical protein
MKLIPPPGPERRRQLTSLFVLVILLAGFVIYRYSQGRTQAQTPASTKAGLLAEAQPPAKPAAQPKGPPMPEAVRLADLDPVVEETAPGRNPFRFGVRPPPPAPPPPPPMPIPEPLPPPPPPIPQVPLTYTGIIVGASQERVAILKDSQSGALFYAKDGDILDGRYRVVKVGETSALVEWVDGTGRRTLTIR